MGKLDFTINLAKRTANFLKTCGKESVLVTKPQSLKSLKIGGLKLAAPLKGDICNFTRDPTFSPELLEELLHVKGTQVEKAMQIKDRFLRALGYKSPELVREGNYIGNMDFTVDFFDGTLSVCNKKELPIKQLIPAIRHEIDHIDKFAKVVKSVGVDKAEKTFLFGLFKFRNNIGKFFDKNFWLKMSEDADITNFDVKKYLDAIKNYSYETTMGAEVDSIYTLFCRYHKYCNNEFEKSAYGIQKKFLKYYGEEDHLLPDIAGERFGRIKKLIESYIEKNKSEPIPNFNDEMTFNILSDISVGMSKPEGVKALKYIKDGLSGKIQADQAELYEQVKVLQNIYAKFTVKDQEVYMDRIYQWLKEGKFTLDDFDFG